MLPLLFPSFSNILEPKFSLLRPQGQICQLSVTSSLPAPRGERVEEREVSKVCTHARTGAGLSCVMAQSFKMGLTKDHR